MNPRIPASLLARYYQSPYWPERFACALRAYGIAQNPNTAPEIRRQLTLDPNIIFRGAARDGLETIEADT